MTDKSNTLSVAQGRGLGLSPRALGHEPLLIDSKQKFGGSGKEMHIQMGICEKVCRQFISEKYWINLRLEMSGRNYHGTDKTCWR